MKYRLLSLSITAALFTIWQIISVLQWIPELYLPSPVHVFDALRATSPEIFQHAASTWARALCGFGIGAIVGMLAGFMMSWGYLPRAILDPIVEAVRPVPAIAALPFMILWFGTGDAGQIVLIALSCAAILAVDVFNSVRNVSPTLVKAARSLGASRLRVFRTIFFPAILPHLTAGLRICATLSLTVAIAAEFMGAQWGLGFIIMRARRTLETHTILMATILIGIIARITDVAIQMIMRRFTRWAETSTASIATNLKESDYEVYP